MLLSVPTNSNPWPSLLGGMEAEPYRTEPSVLGHGLCVLLPVAVEHQIEGDASFLVISNQLPTATRQNLPNGEFHLPCDVDVSWLRAVCNELEGERRFGSNVHIAEKS
jgi:hypothetical protein